MTEPPRFEREFKPEAVHLWREVARSSSEVAIDLGISEHLLIRRHKQLSVGNHTDDAFPGYGKLVSADHELRRLRRRMVCCYTRRSPLRCRSLRLIK